MASESLIYRIKAIWQGGRATAEAAQDIQGVGKAGGKAGSSLKSLMGTAAVAGAAIAGAAYTAREAWEAIGEGADQLRLEEKFAAAAENIGTTATTLKRAVMDATGGMISEAEATAGALELIDTGLAGNQDEVVRLSRLVGELGWDMQALTLTMLNDSEKRLDTLGLSAERVAELEQKYLDLGMAHEQAFDIAVMEAGEEKLALYGSAAESTAGKMAKIEASWKNILDSGKQAAAQAAGPLISLWAGQIDARKELNRLEEQGIITARERAKLWRQVRVEGVGAIEEQVAAAEARLEVATRHERMLMAQTDAEGNYIDVTERGTRATDKYTASLDELAQQGREAAKDIQWLAEVKARANQETETWTANLAGPFFEALTTGAEGSANFNAIMLEQAAAAGASTEELALLAVATGEYTHAQAAAAIETAAMAEKAGELGAAVASGAMSAYEAVDALKAFKAQLEDTQGDYYARFHFQTIGGPPTTTGPGTATGGLARAHGGPVASGQPYIVGERGPEWFVPNQSGMILPNGQTPTTTGASGGAMIQGVPGMIQVNVATMGQARAAAGAIAQGLAVRG